MVHVAPMSLEDLVEEWDPLALRRLQDDALAPEEDARLTALDVALRAALPPAQGLSAAVSALVAEARRLAG